MFDRYDSELSDRDQLPKSVQNNKRNLSDDEDDIGAADFFFIVYTAYLGLQFYSVDNVVVVVIR